MASQLTAVVIHNIPCTGYECLLLFARGFETSVHLFFHRVNTRIVRPNKLYTQYWENDYHPSGATWIDQWLTESELDGSNPKELGEYFFFSEFHLKILFFKIVLVH